MKSERRHELQHNELADWLGDWLVDSLPYAKAVLGVVILLGVAAGVWAYVNSRDRFADEAAWTAYFAAMDGGSPDGFKTVVENYPKTAAAQWATQAAGEVHLNAGLRELFSDREKAKEELAKARESYETVTKSATEPMLQVRAFFGLAQTLESQGDVRGAEENYERVIRMTTDASLAKFAQTRLDQLKRPATQEWYAWFSDQKPVKSSLQDPGVFQDLPQLPDKPNLDIPQPGQLTPSGSGTSSSGSSGNANSPQGTTETPATEAPATETPVEKPSSEAPGSGNTDAGTLPALPDGGAPSPDAGKPADAPSNP